MNGFVYLDSASGPCSFTCSGGFSDLYGMIECPRGAQPGDEVTVTSITCESGVCAPVTLPPSWENVEQNCVDRSLPAREFCELQCMPGYSSNFGIVMCPINADPNGQTPVVQVIASSSDPIQSIITSGMPPAQPSLTQCMAFWQIYTMHTAMEFQQIDDTTYPVCGIDLDQNRIVYNTNSNAADCSEEKPCPDFTSSLQCKFQEFQERTFIFQVVSTTRGSQQDDEEKKSDDFDENETFSV